jgi:hypothetical protein
MPGQDGTGPLGYGPRTGRGLGPCGLGLGFGRRMRANRGLGRYCRLPYPQTKEEEMKVLKEYRQALEEELEDVKKEEEDLATLA